MGRSPVAGREVVYLVDASVYVFRAWHSIPDVMTDRTGRPMNALYGYARFLGDLLERVRPGRIAVAFDASLAHCHRNAIYPAYKANRDPPPPQLERQFAICRELTSALGVLELADERYEADDIIGTLLALERAVGRCGVIVSRDKDLAQLIADGDEYWDYARDRRYGYADVAEVFGVCAAQIADYLALCGDSVDNIPGVPGIGPKTATVLLEQFGSLERLYANLEAVPALPLRGATSIARRLESHREAAMLARRLTAIVCDAPLAFDDMRLERACPDLDSLERLYDAAGFGAALRLQARRIAQEFDRSRTAGSENPPPAAAGIPF
ncbi:5'-3' exonuclease H3TH domain-containing protein [soil metagenome]